MGESVAWCGGGAEGQAADAWRCAEAGSGILVSWGRCNKLLSIRANFLQAHIELVEIVVLTDGIFYRSSYRLN